MLRQEYPHTVFVVLDINKNDPAFKNFEALSPAIKIQRIANYIEEVVRQIEATHKDVLIITAFREDGITGNAENRGLKPEEKKLFKDTMLDLSKTYPQLVIMGGIPSVKYSNDPEKFQSVKSAYKNNQWLQQIEANSIFPHDKHIHRELQNFKKIKRPSAGFHILRCSAYGFFQGEVWRHDKSAPYFETHNENYPNLVFQPAKGRNLSNLYLVKHPFTKEVIPIAVDLCLEHQFGVAKRTIQSDTFLYILFSDSTNLNLENIKSGSLAIQLDSKHKARLITLTESSINQMPIEYYQTNVLDEKFILTGPLMPVYPISLSIKSNLESLNSILKNEELVEYKNLKQEYHVNSIFYGSTSNLTLTNLLKNLTMLREVLHNHLKDHSDAQIATCHSLISEMEKRANEELSQNSTNDYQATTDAAVLKK